MSLPPADAAALRNPGRALLRTVVTLVAWLSAVVALWWLVVAGFALDPLSAKTPADVWTHLVGDPDAGAHRAEIVAALGRTLADAGLGFAAGTAAACGLAAGVVLWRAAEYAVMPLALVLRAVPLAAMAPVITLVLGQGVVAKTVVAGVVVFFPTFVNVILGLRSVSRQTTDLMVAYGAGPAQLFLKARMPAALPAFMASLRIAVPGALIGVLIAEWLVTGNGLGAFMINAQNSLDYTALWAAAAVLTGVAVVLYLLVELVERSALARQLGGPARN